MPRARRIDFAGAWHHVVNRGARRAPIFKVDEQCDTFLTCLHHTQARHSIEVHGYSLMPNHYHLLVRSARGNLSDAMQYLGGRYTRWVNDLHGWDGPVFKGRYRNQVLPDPASIRAVLAYIHINPVRARLVTRLDEQDAWTSHRSYAGLEVPPEWLCRDTLLDELGGAKGVHEFVQQVWTGARPWPDNLRLEDGWFLPTEQEGPWSVHRSIRDGPPTPVVEPERLLGEIKRITGMSRAALQRARAGAGANPERRFAAWALTRFTTLSQRRAGAMVGMSQSHTSHALARLRILPPPLDAWAVNLEHRLFEMQSPEKKNK